VDSTGTYSVTITDANGCSNSDTIMVSIGVGLDELLSQQAVQTYPNPSMGDLVVEIDAAIRGSFQLTVIDQQGRVVRQQPLQLNGRNTRHSLDLNKEAAGIYFLKLQGEDYSWVRRIALQ
ncbi:MAG: T9SS type A sorting domain-containing protein, partial [Salibacteraceae bacterium]